MLIKHSEDLDYLMIEEDLIAYCTAELQAFCGEEDGGLQEVHSAGVVDACESVLRTEDLMDTAFHDTLMLLATLCTNDEVRHEASVTRSFPLRTLLRCSACDHC